MNVRVTFPRADAETLVLVLDAVPRIDEWLWHEKDWWSVWRVLWKPNEATKVWFPEVLTARVETAA